MNKTVYTFRKGLEKGDIAQTSDGQFWFKVVENLGDGVYKVEWLNEYKQSKANSAEKKKQD